MNEDQIKIEIISSAVEYFLLWQVIDDITVVLQNALKESVK